MVVLKPPSGSNRRRVISSNDAGTVHPGLACSVKIIETKFID